MHEQPTALNELLERPGDTAKVYSHRKSVEASTRRNCLLFGKSADMNKTEAAHFTAAFEVKYLKWFLEAKNETTDSHYCNLKRLTSVF